MVQLQLPDNPMPKPRHKISSSIENLSQVVLDAVPHGQEFEGPKGRPLNQCALTRQGMVRKDPPAGTNALPRRPKCNDSIAKEDKENVA